MNNGEKTLLARVDERVKNIQEDIKDIKITLSNDHTKLAKAETKLNEHLNNHKRDLTVASLIIGVVALVASSLI